MKDVYILGIETSCDETSISIVKNGCIEISTVISTQMDTHAIFGGVVPEIASRMHIENITIVLEECLKKSNMTMDDITAIAYTYGPGLIGSLLVGNTCAKTLSLIYEKPLIPVHHIAGHIYANNLVKPMQFPLLALVVSGGHTELIYMKNHYNFEKIGGTLDDAVGEAYDKVARVLELSYPGGPKVDKMAHIGNDTYNLPLPLDDETYNFSFSGIKTGVINYIHNATQKGEEINKADVAASFEKSVVEVLVDNLLDAAHKYNITQLALAGGVASNSRLRQELEKRKGIKKVFYPSPVLCTDNGAMVACCAYYEALAGNFADTSLNAVPFLSVEFN